MDSHLSWIYIRLNLRTIRITNMLDLTLFVDYSNPNSCGKDFNFQFVNLDQAQQD